MGSEMLRDVKVTFTVGVVKKNTPGTSSHTQYIDLLTDCVG